MPKGELYEFVLQLVIRLLMEFITKTLEDKMRLFDDSRRSLKSEEGRESFVRLESRSTP